MNREFEVLYEFMEKLPDALKPGGRVAILTFHSGEDKLVKKALKAGYKAEERLLKVAKTLHNNRQISQEQLCSKLSAYFHFKADQLPDMPFFSQKYIFLFFSLHLPLEKLKLHFLHLSQYGRKLYDVLAPIVSAGYPHSFSAV